MGGTVKRLLLADSCLSWVLTSVHIPKAHAPEKYVPSRSPFSRMGIGVSVFTYFLVNTEHGVGVSVLLQRRQTEFC